MSELKTLLINCFDGGINTTDDKRQLPKNQLCDCLNMWYDGSVLKTRSGLVKKDFLSFSDQTASAYSIKLIGNEISTDDGIAKIFLLSKIANGNFYSKLLIIRSDFSTKLISFITLLGADFNNNIGGVNCLMIHGKATKSSGIYILTGVISNSGSLTHRYIYELNTSLDGYRKLKPYEIYAPLVSVNGKGNLYDKAELDMNYPEPAFAEDFNLLGTAFRSAYKTDGASSVFYLPTTGLSANEDEEIKIIFTGDEGKEYSFTISPSAISSEEKNINGENYHFKINRAEGKLTACNELDAATALPLINGVYNNLVVTAYKNPKSDRLFLSSVSANYNSRVFMSGVKDEGNIVCFSKRNNPLYIPESSVAYLGDNTGCVTAIKMQNDRIIVFKSHEIGICSTISPRECDDDMLLRGKVGSTNYNESMDIKTVSDSIGCAYPQSIATAQNRLIFFGTDKKVYTITSTSNYLQRFYPISKPIENDLLATRAENVFSVYGKNHYMLFLDNDCYLCNCLSNGFSAAGAGNAKTTVYPSWFHFKYPLGTPKLFCALSGDNNLNFIGAVPKDGEVGGVILFSPSGTSDSCFDSSLYETISPIKSKFSTAVTDFSYSGKKNIFETAVTFGKETGQNQNPVHISYTCGETNFIGLPFYLNKPQSGNLRLKKRHCIKNAEAFGVSLSREGTFSVKSVEFFFKKLKQKG